jgi:hypothetical protein
MITARYFLKSLIAYTYEIRKFRLEKSMLLLTTTSLKAREPIKEANPDSTKAFYCKTEL